MRLIGIWKAVLLTTLVVTALPRPASGLVIIRNFVGGQPGTNDVGTGNLIDIFNTAADIWETAIRDPHVVTLNYGWGPSGGGEHTLNRQGGTPPRELEGTIWANNDNDPGHNHYFLDPTPRQNEEYGALVETNANFGTGLINAARYYTNPRGDAASFYHVDLLTVMLHEIGHSLGLSMAYSRFVSETTDFDIDVTAPRPFAGAVIKLSTNLFGVTGHIESPVYGTLMSGCNPRERRLPSGIDILANAQLSQFTSINLPLAPALKIQRFGTNLVISWREIVPSFALEKCTGPMGSGGVWSAVTSAVTSTNGVCSCAMPVGPAVKFFRLKKK